MIATPNPIAGPVDSVKANSTRLDWVDNLRTAMIVLVVNMHACVTYSHVGSWYFNAPPELTIPQKIPFFIWQAHLQAFFMGILFFIAGFYADRSLSRKGAGPFLRERVKRLGIPTLIYMLAVHPFIVIVLHPGWDAPSAVDFYKDSFARLGFLGNSGPMWFALALLIFSTIFAAVNKWLPSLTRQPLRLNAWWVVALGLTLGLLSFLVRTVQPQGTSVLNMQFCYFSQYVVVFGLGVVVSRRDWLNAIALDPVSKKIGICALIFGPLVWLAVVLMMLPVPDHGPIPLDGGWNKIAFLYAMWEQLTGVGVAIGAMYFCAHKLTRRTPLSAWLSDHSFGVYFLHPPVLIALCLLVQPFRTNAYVMSLLMTLATLLATFALAALAKKLPILKTIL